MSELVVGLTGGIGSGKTAVSDRLATHGIAIIDADVIARQVVEPGTPALAAIIERFGRDVVGEQGQLDRLALREKVFSDTANKDWLNGLLHPTIRQEMLTQTQDAQSPYCILSIPLLVENQLQSLVNKVIVVDVEESIQVARASKRDDQTVEQVERIMAAQATRAQRLAAADFVIDNNSSLEALYKQVDELHYQLLGILKIQPRA